MPQTATDSSAHDPADQSLDAALTALADANRRAILAALRDGPTPVGRLASGLGLSQQTTSHHLGVLRRAGLVSASREGTRHLFVVDDDGLAAVRSYLDDFWPSRLAALKAAVESREETPDA
ncbi:ArsR/SmtB family transcription factor [Leifsonia shinshuensis]|uniref:Helix-turn-helix transcriptional regulator n=1 Tax=Leifsonia shinshuensis TaxID=150026 RepID=A0A7G6YFH6_9MICO|nr:metalloregulator ArsR/SmtB family transcription factor [Leifsonia shinshuensis]QNE37241.1 helix-turn-helix transcriptional regulator [Leifsonia shinshuensis]